MLILMGLGSCDRGDPSPGPPEPVAPVGLKVSQESFSLPQEGGTCNVSVTAPSRPSVSGHPDWIVVKDGIYKDYILPFTITVSPYGGYGSRSGSVTFGAGSLAATVTITQQGLEKPGITDPDIATVPVTAGATGEAKSLYDYLLSNYGKRILSSVMADVAWNNDVAGHVYRSAGKYPAINCYDFIHIHRSGENWINYSDLSPVTGWYGAGGIISLMWHFNVPRTAAAPGNTTNTSFYSSETAFKASNVFVEGSWEQVWFDYYVEKVAEVILAMQEKGIAAIWRPFHEAAGNYYAITYNGAAWFWWGSEGPEVYRKLWNRLQDAFAAKGIRNLIWVWTAQNHNGDMASYNSDEPFYPGDSRVDIVARDLYGGSANDCVLEFAQLQNTYSHKMIALGECGWGGSPSNPIATIPDQWNADARWSWFMVWCYNNKTSMAGDDWWKAAFADSAVITRDQVNY